MKKLSVKIKNMQSHNGNPVPNQFVIETGEGRLFKSYDSNIAFIDKRGNVTLDAGAWDYSTTTGKYRNLFLGEDKKATERKIKDGIYKLDKLN